MHSSSKRTAHNSRRLLRGRWCACLSACWDTHPLPQCGPGDPHPGAGLETPLGVGLETYNACWDTTPFCGHTDTCKTTFAGGKNNGNLAKSLA